MLQFMGSQRVGHDLIELKQLGDLMTYLKTLIRNIDSTKYFKSIFFLFVYIIIKKTFSSVQSLSHV